MLPWCTLTASCSSCGTKHECQSVLDVFWRTPLRVMQIRDATASKERKLASTPLRLTVKCMEMDGSMKLTAVFPRHFLHSHKEFELVMKQKRNVNSTSFNLVALYGQVCLRRFRSVKCALLKTAQSLLMTPDHSWTKRRRYWTNKDLSTAILTRRFGTACRWSELGFDFSYSAPVLFWMFYDTSQMLFDQYHFLVVSFQFFLDTRASLYSDAIKESGAPLYSCAGFIDATNICIAEPRKPIRAS